MSNSEIMARFLARRRSSSWFRPLGSTMTPDPSTMAAYFSLAEQDLVGAEITVGATSLQLEHGGRVEVQLAVDTEDILAHRERGHAVRVVRNTTQLGALASEEGLPPGSTTAREHAQ